MSLKIAFRDITRRDRSLDAQGEAMLRARGQAASEVPPDGHLWTNPEEKPLEGVTCLMAIYGRGDHLWAH
jgi:hypothetical protein